MKRQKFLKYNQTFIGEEEINEVVDTLKSEWITMGPKTIKFEKLIAEYVGAKHAIAVNSCTAALHLSLIALGIGKEDEVITTPNTFASTGNVIMHTGAKPIFVDIKNDTYNIDPEKVKTAITPKTKAIIPVHYAGQACDMKAIMKIADDYDLFIIEDAAHAIGAKFEDRKIGSFGDTTCFSFYATKNMTTGEGGAITTDDEKLADKLRILRLHGISKNAWERYSEKGRWHYDIEEYGWKYNMTDIQAALGIHQISKLDKFIKIRRKYAKMYNEELGTIDGIKIPYETPNAMHVFHLYPILLKNYNRDRFIKQMHEMKIGCSVHFIPLHLHPVYQKTFGFKKGDFQNAEFFYEREVSLPLYPSMKEEDVRDVIEALKEIMV